MNQNITVQECLDRYARGENITVCGGKLVSEHEKGAEPSKASAPEENKFTPLL